MSNDQDRSTAEPPDALLSERELADRWGYRPASLASARWRGRGPAWVKIGRTVRYRLSDVLAHELSVQAKPQQ